jgi:serralysin
VASFFDLTSAPSLANPFLAGLLHTTVFKRDATIYYAFEDGSGVKWSHGGADKAFGSAVNAWASVIDLKIKWWPINQKPGETSGIVTWLERLDYGGADSQELGSHSLPSTGQMVGKFNVQHPIWSSENNQKGGLSYVTLLHEIGHALGLDHPHGGTLFPGVQNPSDLGAGALNQSLFTVMSYNDGYNLIGDSPSHAYGWQGTPAAFDIAAAQAVYGANLSTGAGDDVYKLPGSNAAGTYSSCIWDAGGSDTLTAEGLSQACTIDLRAATLALGDPGAGGRLSRAEGVFGGFTIANNVTIENALGGNGNDQLFGNDAANALSGGAGSDRLSGGHGTDRLDGGEGDDFLIGEAGADTIFGGNGADRIVFALDGDWIDGGAGDDALQIDQQLLYSVVREADGFRITHAQSPASVYVKNIENVEINGSKKSFDDFRTASFDGLSYVASYADLRQAFGVNKEAGRLHFLAAGEAEGRSISFDPARYAAGYADLVAAFGDAAPKLEAAAEHYIRYGVAEGRSATAFDPISYAAANPWVMQQTGLDASALSKHYLTFGARAGLNKEFDAIKYLSGYADLIVALGADKEAATRHYARDGYAEGRTTDGIDALRYIASYGDLVGAFGLDVQRATDHYVRSGFAEGRAASFDSLVYTASYQDLIVAFGTDAKAATTHFIAAGHAEGRGPSFDPVAYLLSYSDLGQARIGVSGALKHWITSGYGEGRSGDRLFGDKQADHRLQIGGSVAAEIDSSSDKDWFEINLKAGEHVRIALLGEGAGGGSLQDGLLRLHDSLGRQIAEDDDGGSGKDALLDFTAASAGTYYVVALGAVPGAVGSFTITAETVMG